MTWHEDREINPGVPDLSYVVKPGRFETGWLELKAVLRTPGTSDVQYEIEPSQHTWVEAHCRRVPVHFLLGHGDEYYLLDGQHHKKLVRAISLKTLEELGHRFHESELRAGLAQKLADFTDRERHVE